MTTSPPTVRALHGVVVSSLVLALVGCGGSSARFELNGVYIKKQEELVGQEFTRQQREDIESTLARLFGTPDKPQLPDAAAVREVLDPATLKTGAGLYRKNCSHCHGIAGSGVGREAKDLDPYPRDYRRGIFKYKSTPKGIKPTDADLRRLLYNGIPGTKMPRFGSLDEDRLAALVQYVEYLSIRGEVERTLIEDSSELEADVGQRLDRSDEYLLGRVVEPVAKSWRDVESLVTAVPPEPELDDARMAESIRRGWRLFYGEAAGCAKCHGDPPLDTEAANDYDDWSKELEPSRLTPKKLAEYVALGALPPRIIKPRHLRDGVFHGGKRPEDIYRRILNGIDGTPMPAATVRPDSDPGAAGLSPRDVWDLVHYVLNMPNQPVGPPPDAEGISSPDAPISQ